MEIGGDHFVLWLCIGIVVLSKSIANIAYLEVMVLVISVNAG